MLLWSNYFEVGQPLKGPTTPNTASWSTKPFGGHMHTISKPQQTPSLPVWGKRYIQVSYKYETEGLEACFQVVTWKPAGVEKPEFTGHKRSLCGGGGLWLDLNDKQDSTGREKCHRMQLNK
jgi:hypothetical protein